MRIPAVTTFLVALTTSVVAAAPERNPTPPAHEAAAPTREEGRAGRVAYNDAAPKAPADVTTSTDPWIEIASPTPASHGREYIVLGSDAAPLTHLRVSAASGRPAIRAVRVEYVRGGHKTFTVGKVLKAKRSLTLDLRGPREIEQVVVITNPSSEGTYALSGRTVSTGDVALR